MDLHNKKQRFIFWGIFLGIAAAVLTLTPALIKANAKGLLWIGLGESEGKYEEKYYNIDKEVKGASYEYMEYKASSQRPSHGRTFKTASGSTSSWFVHYTLFDPEIYDDEDRRHKLSFTEIIPYWGRGYNYTIHLSDKLSLLTSADLFFGVGLITFEKQVESVGRYDHKFGYDIGYGWGLNAIFVWDDSTFIGWRSLNKTNRIKLDYGDSIDNGYLTHRRDIFLVLGYTFSGAQPNCVETLYVKC